MTSVDTLLASLGKYKASSAISVSADTTKENTTTLTVQTGSSSVKKSWLLYANGVLAAAADVTNGTAVYEAPDSLLTKEEGKMNTVQVRGMDASGNLLSNGSISSYVDFTKKVAADALSGTVTISGDAKVGAVLRASKRQQ